METIVVNYFENQKDLASGTFTLAPLGREVYEGVSEVLLPGTYNVFCVKRFTGNTNYRWFVDGVTCASAPGDAPAVFHVILSKIFSSYPEVYLKQTLILTKASLARTVQPGTLVEVDYGFIQDIGREDGQTKTNKRYSDTLQKGEMHKRRLAVVISTNKNSRVQIAPVTSDGSSQGDRTCFELSRDTLDKLSFYGSSGKSSWVLCSMIETVSISRVLPPVSITMHRGNRKTGRDVNYSVRLSGSEKAELKTALLHSINVTDYQSTKDSLVESRKDSQALAALELLHEQLQLRLAEVEASCEKLKLVEEVARMWEAQLGNPNGLDAEVGLLRQMYAEEMDKLVHSG